MSDRAIIEAIQQAAGTQLADTVFSITATVVAVNRLARTCTVTILTGKKANEIPDVRLMAALDDGVLIIPAIGSTVHIIMSTYTEPYVSQYSAVESIVFLGGALGGLVVTPLLVQRLNLLEDKVNDIINTLNSHTHTGVTTGAGLSGPLVTPVDGTLTDTVAADIENSNITHG